MAFDVIGVGAAANDGTGDPLRTAFGKVNDNFVKAAVAAVVTINAQVGTTYTLALADSGALVTCDNGAAVTVTIPLASSIPFAAGATIAVAQLGAGAVTVTGAAGVTVNGTDGGTSAMSAAYEMLSLVRLAADTWLVV